MTVDTTPEPRFDETRLVRILEVHRDRPLADLDGLMDLGRAYARSASFPVLDAVDRWLASQSGHNVAANLDAVGCFLRGYWQEANETHDRLVARFLDYADANAPEDLDRVLPSLLVFLLSLVLHRTSSPEIVHRTHVVLARIAGVTDRVRLSRGVPATSLRKT